MQDVGEHQLLVLLLVVQAQFGLGGECAARGVRRVLQQAQQRGVDMFAVTPHLVERWPRQQSALRSRMPWAERFVIRIEEVGVVRVEWRVASRVAGEHDGLEEPGRVRDVPLGRARVRHGLQGLILRRQRRGERDAVRAHIQVASQGVAWQTCRSCSFPSSAVILTGVPARRARGLWRRLRRDVAGMDSACGSRRAPVHHRR